MLFKRKLVQQTMVYSSNGMLQADTMSDLEL